MVSRRSLRLEETAKANWASAKQWPVGIDFIAVQVGDETYLWGGRQNREPLPRDIVYVYNRTADSWRTIKATGDIPLHSVDAAIAVCDGVFYIHGGVDQSGKKTNTISSFSPTTGEFKVLSVVGDRPSPRCAFEGWTFEGKLIFFAGRADKVESGTAGFLVPPNHDGYRDDLLSQYDPETESWSAIVSFGPRPCPRMRHAVATRGHLALVHGGNSSSTHCGDILFGDISMLDMRSMTWTLLASDGPKLLGHSLSPIAPFRFLLVGGCDGTFLKKVWSFDSQDSKWKEEEPLSSEMIRGGDGLAFHRAVVANTEKGLSVMCFGGDNSNGAITHPNKMIIFDIE